MCGAEEVVQPAEPAEFMYKAKTTTHTVPSVPDDSYMLKVWTAVGKFGW